MAPAAVTALNGMTRERLRDALGVAEFVRQDGPVLIWRYPADSCFLDVFLYREGEFHRVNHVAARARDGGPVAAAACYDRLIARRAPRAG